MISYSFVISACENGQQPEQDLSLLPGRQSSWLEPDVISYSPAISAGDKGHLWKQALRLWLEIRSSGLELGDISTAMRSAVARRPAVGAGLGLVARDAALLAGADVVSYKAALKIRVQARRTDALAPQHGLARMPW